MVHTEIQCEIRRPSARGYYFDIVWIDAPLARRGNVLADARGNWTVHEVHGRRNKGAGRSGDFIMATAT